MFHSPRGEALRNYTLSPDDYCGHGTIRAWYGIDAGDGIDKECTAFISPQNFPMPIVKALKKGAFRGLGMANDLLTTQAWAEYRVIQQPVWAKYKAIEQQAWAEYEAIQQPALAKYQKIRQQAFWDLFAILENRAEVWR